MPEFAFDAPANTVVRVTTDTVEDAADALKDMQSMDALRHANGAQITELSIHHDEATLIEVDGVGVDNGPAITKLTGGYIEIAYPQGVRCRLRLPTAAEVDQACQDSDRCQIEFTGYHLH